MRSVAAWVLVLCACVHACAAEGWRWPEGAPALRIDTKVHFIDGDGGGGHQQKSSRVTKIQPEQFEIATDAAFYSLAPSSGRYPVRVQTYQDNSDPAYNFKKTSPSQYSDGTLDSVPVQCKCVSKPECRLSGDSTKACGSGKYLCCYKRPHRKSQNTELYNEVDDERRDLFSENRDYPGAFPPPPESGLDDSFGPGHSHNVAMFSNLGNSKRPVLVGPEGPTGLIGPPNRNQGVLTGPGGPTGIIGPASQKQDLLVGPGGPTRIIGPAQQNKPILLGPGGPTGVFGPAQQSQPILVGPGGPTGIIGPKQQQSQAILVGPEGPSGIIGPAQNRPILVGPGGPTGSIGPQQNKNILVGPGGSTGIIGPAHNRPILVGPGGPTGSIGPQQNKNVLVGPGGPTGVIGPGNKDYYHDRDNYDIGSSESAQRGVLVGPGGPTGIIGPVGYGGRPVLVGPGGPTGIIGPARRGGRPVLVGPGGPTGVIGPPRRPYYYGK